MGAAMMRRIPKRARQASRSQEGFTLIEVMIAIAIMTVSLVGLMAVFGTAVKATDWAQEDLIARQKALEAMESIYTARNTQQISFAAIANIGSGPGIFVVTPMQLKEAGPDGLVGTADDVNYPGSAYCPGVSECYVMPGPDGILGTADDVGMSLANFTRQITINPVLESDGVTINPNLKQIVVTVSYTKGGLATPQNYTVDALISSYR